jgi:hypothetical protein
VKKKTWSVAGEVNEKQRYDHHAANIFSNQDECDPFKDKDGQPNQNP